VAALTKLSGLLAQAGRDHHPDRVQALYGVRVAE